MNLRYYVSEIKYGIRRRSPKHIWYVLVLDHEWVYRLRNWFRYEHLRFRRFKK